MKKFVLSLIVMLCASLGASAQKVYIAPSKSAIAYHKSKDCSYLRNSKNVTDISTSEAKEMGRHPCVLCYPAQAEATKKAIAKEQAEKKATTAKKATTTKKTAETTTTKATGTSKVYVAAGGAKYHKKKSCTALAKSKNVNSITLAEAKEKLTPCSVCYETAKKAAPKASATTKKAEEKAAEATTTKATGTSKVYVAAGGSKYHKKKSCTALAKSKDIKSVTLAEAKAKMTPCSVCYTSAKKTATKAATTKKATTTEKKATTTEKKTTTKKAA